MPEGARYVGRPSGWGNPFRPGKPYRFVGARGALILGVAPEERAGLALLFEWYMAARRDLHEQIRRELGGRDLACWCPLDSPCHANTLLLIANGDD